MKRLITVLAVAALAGAWGLAQNAPVSSLTIPVIVKATNSQYWQYVFAGAKAAAKDLGINVKTLGAPAESDVAQEISILEDAVTQNPPAIVIAPTAYDPLAAPIEKATKAGIPVIVIDSSVNTNAYASFLSTDNEAAGRLAADQLAAAIKAKTGSDSGNVAYLTALPNVGSLTARDKGFTEEIASKYPNLKVVDHRYGNNDPAKALSNTNDILTKYPDLVGIFADNNMMGDGAGRSVQENNKTGKISLVAFDTDDQEISFLKSGVIDALIVQDPYMMGYAGVWYAAAAHFGARLPKNLDTGVSAVTKANIDQQPAVGLLDASKRQLSPFTGQ
ncbi:MAG: ABC transporter substrate-binding protein [Deinococcales bacterium]